ncbi:hypothetical protein [uncultured Reyranella sp.]|jgi:hypothetical protein|uniref:hypothetical protein n=1 Tax=uncultured Reyranella sp. TaxID=735512 RepID=UPI00259D11C5|nr:hypothetical protein [uncultured Reyranella sp.]
MYYVSGLLNHLKVLQRCVAEFDGSATLDVSDLSLDVRIGASSRRFFPQFVIFRESRRLYSSAFTADVRAFIGWRPYEARRWPETADKLLFKKLALEVGVRVPGHWEQADANAERVLVKQRRSSFGEGIRGPFEFINDSNPEHQLKVDEYYESFVAGRIAKGWYLNGELLSLELRPPPFVTGDGRSTVLELARARSVQEVDERALSWIIGAQGRRLHDVLDADARVVVDFRYSSPYEIGSFINENVCETLRNTGIGRQFQQAGYSLLAAIPEEMRVDTLITLDAVVDANDKVWFLEINSNPAVHPDAYPALLKGAFERAARIAIERNQSIVKTPH